jgi:serine/threonine-protein kinase
MVDSLTPSPEKRSASQDTALAQVLNEVLEALQAGRSVDMEALAAQLPAHADELRRLVPVMRTCAQISCGTEGSGSHFGDPEYVELGDFLIQRELGRGGMGIVYEAQQLSLRRRVALKVLPFAGVLDSRALRRFQNEAQAAALLHHPHIVPVYGVGCDRGVHYYAMQLIEGTTLASVIGSLRQQTDKDTPVVAERRSESGAAHAFEGGEAAEPSGSTLPLDSDTPGPGIGDAAAAATVVDGPLSTARSHRAADFVRAAVQLGIDVAEALDYAHQEGVVHRDIKPSNLLIDARGQAWVADFGLAGSSPILG